MVRFAVIGFDEISTTTKYKLKMRNICVKNEPPFLCFILFSLLISASEMRRKAFVEMRQRNVDEIFLFHECIFIEFRKMRCIN